MPNATATLTVLRDYEFAKGVQDAPRKAYNVLKTLKYLVLLLDARKGSTVQQ